VTLRNRLAIVNPQRVMIMRGIERPGILMEEAEAVVAQMQCDVFVLRWTDLSLNTQLPSALAQMTCEIHYSTSGTQLNAGLDRGRALEQMDAELLAIVTPTSALKMNYSKTAAVAMETTVFWTEPGFTPLSTQRDLLTRVAKVIVFAHQEPGEL
jgi:hypothetical protein